MVDTDTGDALTMRVNCAVDDTMPESVTVIETVASPVTVVVPLMTPVLEIDNPAGNPLPVNVYEPLPPAALTDAE